MKIRLTTLFTVLLAVVLLAACAAPAAEPASDVSADASAEESSADEEAVADESTDAAAGFPVTVTDAAGNEHTFDEAPRRVVAMWNNSIANLVFIGADEPIATLAIDLAIHPAYYGAGSDERIIMLDHDEWIADYEQVLSLEPDLILSDEDTHAAIGEFVPVFVENYEATSEELFFNDVRVMSQIFGKGDEVEDRISRLLQRAEAYGMASGREKSIYYGMNADAEGDVWWLAGGAATCAYIQPEGSCSDEYFDEWIEVTVEGMIELDPDVIIVEDHGEDYTAETLAALENQADNPLWQELNVVKNEQVHFLNRAVSRPEDPLVLELWMDSVMPLAYPDKFDGPLTDEQVAEILGIEAASTSSADADSDEAMAASTGSADGGDCGEGMRLFEHEALFTEPLCVPAEPQNIAFIDEMVGLVPVLGVESATRSVYFDLFNDDFPNAFSADQVEAMIDIGHPRAAELETILLNKPDLIISGNYWEDANKFLPDIAPTIIWDYDYTPDWAVYFQGIADVINRSEEGKQVLASIDERMAALQEAIGEEPQTYVVVRTMEELDSLQVFTTYNFGAEHAAKLGLTMPDGILTPDEASEVRNAWWYPLSVEELPLIDADHIFLLRGWEEEVQEEFLANPIWQTLNAVQNDRVHFIDGEYWVRTHPIASHRIIDDIFTFVAEVDPAEVAPNPFAYTYE
ncbi:MAG: ABC transporter substrate-binding protein [Chloroflexota bacterium]